jgi:hypothetical protein
MSPLKPIGTSFSKKKKKARDKTELSAIRDQAQNTTCTPEPLEGLRRSPRLKLILDRHKNPVQPTRSSAKRPPSHEGNVYTTFPGLVKFSNLTDLEKSVDP